MVWPVPLPLAGKSAGSGTSTHSHGIPRPGSRILSTASSTLNNIVSDRSVRLIEFDVLTRATQPPTSIPFAPGAARGDK